ncbi:tape measure protein [Nocardia sp. CC227C]|uniref:tape measure protein n=1 Tax=Nocardia sp. CC227C TaxID=3044562 RepID=UPI00278C5577|nr:tape measure protein [Nocardia sp. CC227C]
MAVELAVGYISLVTDASQIPGEIDRQLGRAGRNADQAGRGIGQRLATGLGATFRVGAAAAATAATAAIGTALTKGFGRLAAIDDAQGKLRGLGHDAAAIQKIMDSALASVKGTAFGLGDAATVAATAVAAGIKPGEQLTGYLKLIADTATIAGSSLGEMGSVINQTTTGGIVFTDTLNQLADRGLPVFTWLQDEFKLSGKEFRKMVEDGKLDAQTFQRVLTEHLAGAALESGKTVRGSLANVGAALGRLGASALGPTFARLTGWFGQITEGLDQVNNRLKPFAERLDAILFGQIVPKVAEMWRSFTNSEAAAFLSRFADDVTGMLSGLASGAQQAASATSEMAKSLTSAGGAVAAGAWTAFSAALKAAGDIAGGVLAPALSGLGGVMANNQTLVTALIAGWLAWKLIPPRLQAVGAAMTGLQGRATTAATGLHAIATATGRVIHTAGGVTYPLGRFGSAINQLGTHVPVIARMQQAFAETSRSAAWFARTQGTVAAATVGLRSAASSLTNFLGGPWGVAFAVATIAVVGVSNELRKASQQQNILRESTTQLAVAQREMAKAFQKSEGAVSDEVFTSVSDQIERTLSDVERLGDTKPGLFAPLAAQWKDLTGLLEGEALAGTRAKNIQTDAWQEADAARTSFRELGLSAKEMSEQVTGSSGSFVALVGRLRETSNGGQEAIARITEIREAFLRAQDVAKTTTPGFFALSDAIKVLADETATATDRVNAMKTALDIMGGKPVSAQEAVAQYNEQVRRTAQAAQEAWDASKGFGEQLVKQNGEVNTGTENGGRLYQTLLDIKNATAQVAATGDMEAVNATLIQNEQQYANLANAAGLTTAQVREMAAQMNLIPQNVTTLAELKGADTVEQKLTAIGGLLKANSGDVTIPLDVKGDAEVINALELAGIKVDTLNAKNGQVHISAPDVQKVLNELQQIIDTKLPDKVQNVSLSVETLKKLHEADGGVVVPRAEGAIDGPLPSQARIQQPRPNLVQWAEPETGGEAFIPLASSKRSRSTAILARVADMFGYRLQAFAEGGFTDGRVPRGVAKAISAAKNVSGNKYQWGGTGPTNFDCSGLVGWIQQILMGVTGSTRRLYTTMSLLDGATAGLESGLGPSGTYFKVGVNSQHMAATLNGKPLEAGGAHGTSQLGSPAVGANDGQFTAHFHLPNKLIAGIDEAGVRTKDGKNKKTKEWTEADELRLEGARLDVDEAKANRAEVYEDEDSTELDKRRADLQVRQAEQDLVDLQAEKDERGQDALGDDEYVPEAPALEGRMSDDEIAWESAVLDRDEARDRRDEVYADEESTDRDLRRADLALQSAENKLDELRGKQFKDSFAGKSLELLKKTGFELLNVAFGAISENLPFGFGDLFSVRVNTPSDEDLQKLGIQFPFSVGSFSQEEIDRQLPVTIPTGEDARKLLKPYIQNAPEKVKDRYMLRTKIYDQGGWLKPGEAAINLSRRPEPIFNSPQQLQQFVGAADLAPAQPTGGGDTYAPTFNGMDPHSSARAMERIYRRKTLASQVRGGFGR